MQPLKKYIQQKSENNCGPVAVYNFLVWANQNPRKTDLGIIRKLLGTTAKGTDLYSVLNFLNLFIEFHTIEYFSTRKVNKPLQTLQAGGCFFIVFDGGNNIPHIAFCRGIVNGKLALINAVKDRKELLITKAQFKNLLLNNQIAPIFITVRRNELQ